MSTESLSIVVDRVDRTSVDKGTTVFGLISLLTNTLLPYTSLFRSHQICGRPDVLRGEVEVRESQSSLEGLLSLGFQTRL
jgi:hypothetical protein